MNVEQMVLSLLSLVVPLLIAFVCYWAVRLEGQVNRLSADMNDLRVLLAEQYLRKEDSRQSAEDVKQRLGKIEDKIDALAQSVAAMKG